MKASKVLMREMILILLAIVLTIAVGSFYISSRELKWKGKYCQLEQERNRARLYASHVESTYGMIHGNSGLFVGEAWPLPDKNAWQQPVCDISAFTTLDFSSFYCARVPNQLQEKFHAGLVNALNERIGLYESDSLNDMPIREWMGCVLQLVVNKHADVTLNLLRTSSTNGPAQKLTIGTGFISDSSIFVGPYENGILFLYSISSNTIYSVLAPNRIQYPVVFRRKMPLQLAQNLPRTKESLIDSLRILESWQDNDLPKKIYGWYRCVTPNQISINGQNQECYLKINKGNRVAILFFRDGKYLFDRNLSDVMKIDRLRGPYGRYAFDTKGLTFVRCPPSADDFSRIQAWARRGETNPAAQFWLSNTLRSDNQMKKILKEDWMSGAVNEKIKTRFERCPRPNVSFSNLVFCVDNIISPSLVDTPEAKELFLSEFLTD